MIGYFWLIYSNRIVLNQRKTKAILFGTGQKLEINSDFAIKLQGKKIEQVSKRKWLGVIVDDQIPLK